MEREVKTWNVETADGVHLVEYYPPKSFKKAKLLIDGVDTPIVFRPGYSVVDMPILTGGGHDVRFMMNGKKGDIAYDGVMMDSGEAYEAPKKMSVVNMITTAISGSVIFLGGLIPALCAAGGIALGTFVAVNKQLKPWVKIVLGVLIAILTWALAFGLSHLAGKGINSVEKKLDKSFGKAPYSITLTRDFDTDNDTDGLADDGFDVVFAACSDDAYAFATTITEKKFKLLYGADVTPEEYITGFYDVADSAVKSTDSGIKYFRTENNTYTYIISVCKAAGSYYETQIFCLNEDAEKMVPKIVEWMDSIKIAIETEEAPAE